MSTLKKCATSGCISQTQTQDTPWCKSCSDAYIARRQKNASGLCSNDRCTNKKNGEFKWCTKCFWTQKINKLSDECKQLRKEFGTHGCEHRGGVACSGCDGVQDSIDQYAKKIKGYQRMLKTHYNLQQVS